MPRTQAVSCVVIVGLLLSCSNCSWCGVSHLMLQSVAYHLSILMTAWINGRQQTNPSNQMNFVPPETERGHVVEMRLLSPELVEVFTDNPNGGAPFSAWKRLPGLQAKVVLSGWAFVFIVRVVEVPESSPRVVDLRIYSPTDDVPILNADLRAVPLARIAAAVASGLLTSGEQVFDPERWAASEQHSDAVKSNTRRARGRGRPTKLTDDFLREVARLAREAHQEGKPITAYVAANIEPDPSKQPRIDTVRWWLAEARKRGVLTSGELMGKYKTNTEG